MPLLTQPASTPPAPAVAAGEEDDVEEVEEEAPKKGGKKGKGGGGKKGKSGKGKKDDTPAEGGKDEEEAGEVLLIDEIWPKKEALGLTKWYVMVVNSTNGWTYLAVGGKTC